MKNSNGFTLIELLVVIAISGLLASIAIPQLMGARDQARAASLAVVMSELMIELQPDCQDSLDVKPGDVPANTSIPASGLSPEQEKFIKSSIRPYRLNPNDPSYLNWRWETLRAFNQACTRGDLEFEVPSNKKYPSAPHYRVSLGSYQQYCEGVLGFVQRCDLSQLIELPYDSALSQLRSRKK